MLQWYNKYKQDFSQNFKLALPIMLGQLGQITVYIADNMMVGRLGASPLAAVSLAVAIIAVPTVIGMGISFALPPLISEADGAGDKVSISKYFKHSQIVNIGIGLISFVLMLVFIPFLDYLGQDPEVASLAKGYLFYSAVALIPMMTFFTFRNYSDGMGETMPPMIAMIIGNVVNIALNYVLIFGKFGFHAYGVEGAAIASLVARIAMIIILIFLLLRWKDLWSYISACNFKKYEVSVFNKIFQLGVPTSLQMFFEISAFSGAALIMGLVSKNAQAAHQISINLSSITFMVCTGLAMAATIRVGNQLGQKNYLKMRDAGISAIFQVILIMAVFSLLFVLLRYQLPWLYIDDESVVSISVGLLVYAAIFQIPDGVQVTALAALRGLQDVRIPTFITFISYYVFGIPISYFAAIYFEMGAPGVWLGLLVGLFISATWLTLRFLKLSKKYIEV